MTWDDDLEIVGSRRLPPEPRLMKAIGLNHAFETAIADLVDNSIDAKSRHVLIRFVRRGSRMVGLYVVDDGLGMSDAEIDVAMTVGGTREYVEGDLGHFGFGLKAASLGQATALTVVSRSAGHEACGRRWHAAKAADGFECDVLAADSSQRLLDLDWPGPNASTGTVVRWDGVKTFPRSARGSTTDRFLETTFVRLRHHLGLVFHRMLAAGDVSIGVDVEDLLVHEPGVTQEVEAIDPFAYQRSGDLGYPRDMTIELPAGPASLQLHVWPARSQLVGFKLGGRSTLDSQGFYFYRHGRLLQAGGWNGAAHPDRKYQLARIKVDVDDRLADHVTMNPEKTTVRTGDAFIRALEEADPPDGGFADFLEDASGVHRRAQKRTRTRPKVIPPGRGFAPRVRKAIAAELDYLPGEEPVDIRWTAFEDDSFFDVDRESRTIWLNNDYRWAVLGERDSSLNDAPLVKALMYLLLEDLFRGSYLGSKDRDNVELWGEILAAAADVEAS